MQYHLRRNWCGPVHSCKRLMHTQHKIVLWKNEKTVSVIHWKYNLSNNNHTKSTPLSGLTTLILESHDLPVLLVRFFWRKPYKTRRIWHRSCIQELCPHTLRSICLLYSCVPCVPSHSNPSPLVDGMGLPCLAWCCCLNLQSCNDKKNKNKSNCNRK